MVGEGDYAVFIHHPDTLVSVFHQLAVLAFRFFQFSVEISVVDGYGDLVGEAYKEVLFRRNNLPSRFFLIADQYTKNLPPNLQGQSYKSLRLKLFYEKVIFVDFGVGHIIH